ncbi:MAG: hypothetical protein QM765_31010 [Myxococcales bacterium]
MPTLDELRSLVRGCVITATGGSCTLTTTCNEPATCDSGFCSGCPACQGPTSASGCYAPVELAGLCRTDCMGQPVWSSTEIANGSGTFWSVRFTDAAVQDFSWGGISTGRVLCVRKP